MRLLSTVGDYGLPWRRQRWRDLPGGTISVRTGFPKTSTARATGSGLGGFLSDAQIPDVDIAPLDTDGRLLRLQCEPTSHVPIASSIISFDNVSVRLDILSASHRVLVRNRSSEGGIDGHVDDWEIQETVACGQRGVGSDDVLPASHGWETPRWAMQFSSSLVEGADAVAIASQELRPFMDRTATSIVRRFPGHALALTGLTVDEPSDGHLVWRSWHLYPGDDPHVVVTATEARRATEET